jgi:predicted MFS family arabinose efflux permease
MLSALLGWGTAMVYPTFLATIAENTHPGDRARSIGIFRLWRDAGYAVGAILTGVVADLFGMGASIIMIAVLTFISAFIIHYRMFCRNLNGIKFVDLFHRSAPPKRYPCS